jgi:hypothetical protein
VVEEAVVSGREELARRRLIADWSVDPATRVNKTLEGTMP